MLLFAALACEPWHPELVSVRFPLEGAHLELDCSACHPTDPPDMGFVYRKCVGLGPLQDLCLDCHSCDRALHADGEGHFAGRSCGETGCHATSDLLWSDASPVEGTESGASCAAGCHGQDWPDASPRDDSHLAHLTGQTLWAQSWTCDGCHPPGGASAATHLDSVVDVAFSGLAVGPGGPESATFTGSTCNVYCHGATLPNPPAPPTWNGGAAQVACGTCHGWPPPAPHVDLDLCSACHAPTGGDGQQLADLSTHIDGIVQEN